MSMTTARQGRKELQDEIGWLQLVLPELVRFAKANPDQEICGLIVDGPVGAYLLPGMNTHESPRNSFTMAPEIWLDVPPDQKVIAIYHSHVEGGCEPSDHDRMQCEAHDLPWVIVTPEGEYHFMEPCGFKLPYEGRVYLWGVTDCAAIVRDWYRNERGVDMDKVKADEWFWQEGKDHFNDNFASRGFVEVFDDPQVGDCFLCQFKSEVPNHIVLYVGNDQIIHHVRNHPSVREPWQGGMWQRCAVKHLRHKSQFKRPQEPAPGDLWRYVEQPEEVKEPANGDD